MDCEEWFSIDFRGKKIESVIEDHIDGKPIRKIADKNKSSPSAIARKYQEQLKNLPHNNEITKRHCSRFCGILIADGKFVKVRGYEQKIPLLWGIDYLSHDIPVFELTASESYECWLKYFGYLKSIHYPMVILICDDNENINTGGSVHFPERHHPNLSESLPRKYTKELTNASLVKHAPQTTNLMELYNSHLEARLKSIKGFKSFVSAKKWLNAYILRRRFRPFRSCCRKFGYLNGKTSISQTARKTAVLPLLFI